MIFSGLRCVFFRREGGCAVLGVFSLWFCGGFLVVLALFESSF